MGCSSSISVTEQEEHEAQSDKSEYYIEKHTHISADISERIIKRKPNNQSQNGQNRAEDHHDQKDIVSMNLSENVPSSVLSIPENNKEILKTPVKGILKSRSVTPEVTHDSSTLVERAEEVADKALNILNPYRKYIKRQKNLQKALSWWENEDENPEIGYLDFSRRKILFNFRRGSEASINVRAIHEKDLQSKNDLPSHFLRKWRRAGAVLNATNLLKKSLKGKRSYSDPEIDISDDEAVLETMNEETSEYIEEL